MRSDDRSRIEKAIDGLSEAADKTSRDMQRRRNKHSLVEIREPGAPEPNDYPEDEIQTTYLFDLHEWALEEYRERVEELQDATSIDVEDYPQLGHDRPEDRDERSAQNKQIVETAEKLDRVDEARVWLDQIEDEYADQ